MQRKAPLADRALLARIARRAGTVTVRDLARLLGQDVAWVRRQLRDHGAAWKERAVEPEDAWFLLLHHFPQSEVEWALGEDVGAIPREKRTESILLRMPRDLLRALERASDRTAEREGRLTASLERYITERLLGEIEESVED